MHYEIDYGGLTQEEKEEKAISDMVEYVGQEHFDKIVKAFQEAGPMTQMQVDFYLSFAGIQGYPAIAFAKRYLTLKEDNSVYTNGLKED